MVVHDIYLKCEKPDEYSLDQIQNAVDQWASNHQEVLEDRRVPVQFGNVGEPEVADHLVTNIRFDYSDGKEALLDEIEGTLSSYVAWYRISHHQCEHDGGGSCPPFTTERESGSIPAGI